MHRKKLKVGRYLIFSTYVWFHLSLYLIVRLNACEYGDKPDLRL